MWIKDNKVFRNPLNVNGKLIYFSNLGSDNKILPEYGYTWKEPVVPEPTPEELIRQYDEAMEQYMTDIRSARGYTTREPSDYINSEIPRWKQDAIDWIKFRDAVLLYGLEVQNTAMASGVAPSMEEFLAGMPKIVWTYVEPSETTEEEAL